MSGIFPKLGLFFITSVVCTAVVLADDPKVWAQTDDSLIPKSQCTYFVATNGSDNNSGSESSPFKTITQASGRLQPGQSLCIKGGTYVQTVQIRDVHGTPNSRIRIGEYQGGGDVIVSGNNYSLPNPDCPDLIRACPHIRIGKCGLGCAYAALFAVRDVSHLTVAGIEVRESSGLGMNLNEADNVTIKDMMIRTSFVSGFNVDSTNNVVLDGVVSFDNVRHMAESSRQGGGGMQIHKSDNAHVKGITIVRNFGEGLNVGKNSNNVIIENSLFYENGHTSTYINHGSNIVFNANFHVCTGKKPEWLCENGKCGDQYQDTYGTGITFREEQGSNWQNSYNNAIINSIFVGCTNHIIIGAQGSRAFNPILIANNNFIEALSPQGDGGGVVLRVPAALNQSNGKNLFVNNIIKQSVGSGIIVDPGRHFIYSSNLSSKSIDRPGFTIADPMIVTPFNPNLIDELFEAKPQDFIIGSGSPAIDAGEAPPFSNFVVNNRIDRDFFANVRPIGPQRDIGSYEFGGGTDWDWDIPPDFCDTEECKPPGGGDGGNNSGGKELTWDYTLQDLIRIFEDRELAIVERDWSRTTAVATQEASEPQLIYCKDGQPSTTPEIDDERLYTAIGCIPIGSASAFTIFVLGWALSLGGGVTFLLMIYAAYKIMTSNGDPKKLQSGKELLTAVISGLLLIAFSAFILRLIGSEILKLPGL